MVTRTLLTLSRNPSWQKPLRSLISDIKTIKIQGAENIALAGLDGLALVVQKSKTEYADQLLAELYQAQQLLSNARPTEPALRNALHFVLSEAHREDMGILRKYILDRILLAKFHFHESAQKIAALGAQKIKDGMTIFTHCHSSSVMHILKLAKKEGKSFKVYNTEARPLFQGRITARELAKRKIPVTEFVDDAAELALRKADLFLFGADAITTDFIYNKIGTGLFAHVTKHYGIPMYVCTDAWKFDPLTTQGYEEVIEQRPAREIWKKAPRGVSIKNPAFETIEPQVITGIISELGIFPHDRFIARVEKAYPWMFD